MKKSELVENYLKNNPEFASNVKDAAGLAAAIEATHYVVRDGTLVDPKTNVVADIDQVVKLNSRPFLKVMGTGKYLGQYRDKRTPEQRETQKKETKALLKTWMEKKGYVVPEEMGEIWSATIANNMLPASDSNGGFTLSTIVNGVPVDRHKPDDLFSFISEYKDQEKSRFNELRIEAKIMAEALKLVGLSSMEEAKKNENIASFNEAKELVKKDYYSMPVNKTLPDVGKEALKMDLEKEIAFNSGLNVVPETWTLQERTQLEGLASNYIEDASKSFISSIEKWKQERPASLYRRLELGTYNGLPYPEKE